jgi:predicted phage terminase large subunit-like protein
MPTLESCARNGKFTAAYVASWPAAEREAWLASLTPPERKHLLYDWDYWARDKQIQPEGEWATWLIMAGRGFGKTRTGSEWIRQKIESGRYSRAALVARTAPDGRDVLVEGVSGILKTSSPRFRPIYTPSKRRITWPNGAIATVYSADEPDLLRGPEHDIAWCDELAAWRYPETWDMLQFGLRIGPDPRAIVTTTPRPTKLVKEIKNDSSTRLTVGSTYENVGNLAPKFFTQIVKKFQGTRLGRQELLAELLDDNPDALWKRGLIDYTRWKLGVDGRAQVLPQLERIVVAIDPATTDSETSNETGIIVVGRDKKGHGYVLDDASLRGTPDEWGSAALRAYFKWDADRIIGETNQGGQMVENVMRTVAKTAGRSVSYKGVRASRGKLTRAEPVSAIYEQGLIHHVGVFATLEDQMCDWVPGEDSPDRMDALVWGFHELFVEARDARPVGF